MRKKLLVSLLCLEMTMLSIYPVAAETKENYIRGEIKENIEYSEESGSSVKTQSVFMNSSLNGTIQIPFNSGIKKINVDVVNVWQFVPSETVIYSFWTIGQADTVISVYSDINLKNLVISNNNSGVGQNACVVIEFTKGRNYYITVSAAGSWTSGSYTLKGIKGLPMSGGELFSNFTIFNSSQYKNYTNCYSYALGMLINPITREKFKEGRGVNPGEMAGKSISINDLKNAETAKTAIENAVKQDCLSWGGNAYDFHPLTEKQMPSVGYYKVALVLNPGKDYHWYRQVSDRNGGWAHKISVQNAIDTDYSGATIYFPSSCNRGNYSVFLGYYEIKIPPTVIATAITLPSTSQLSCIEYEKQYPLYHNISIDDFNEFKCGETSEDDVKTKLGEAHSTTGSGFIGDIYYTIEGKKIVIYYCDGLLDVVQLINSDDTRITILE